MTATTNKYKKMRGFAGKTKSAKLFRRKQLEIMARAAIVAAALALGTSAQAQAPGWIPTGEWQCGPVRVVVSIDGYGAIDFFVVGAWFDNHYTVRRGQLYYNSIPCASVGNVWPPQPPRKRQTATPEYSSDRRCNDSLSIEDREKYCE